MKRTVKCLDSTNSAFKDYFVGYKVHFDTKVIDIINLAAAGTTEEIRFIDLLNTYGDYKYDIQDGNMKIDLIKLHPNKGDWNTSAIIMLVAEPHIMIGTLTKQCKFGETSLYLLFGEETCEDYEDVASYL